jgi:Flp pilus assembly protein TadD
VPPEVTVTRLPRSAEHLLLLEASLKLDVPEDERARYLARVRSAARPHGDDPYAMRVLAFAEASWGDAAAAGRLLIGLLAARPDDPELLYLMGLRHFVAARKSDDPDTDSRAAQGWFVRAHQADPNHYPTLYRYAQSLRGGPNYVSENTSNIMLLAHQLAPQVEEIRLNAAAILMNRGEFADAEALLAPLAASPHSRDNAAAAKDLLARARARERPDQAALEALPDERIEPLVAGLASAL